MDPKLAKPKSNPMGKDINNNRQKIRNHFQKVDPVIYQAMANLNFDDWINPNPLHSAHAYFQHLTREIIGQQLSGKAASTIYSRFELLFTNKKVHPKKLLKLNDQILRDAGLSWAKASNVKNIARAYLDKSVKFHQFTVLPDEEIIKELTTIKGIGPWTAEMFLIFTLGREDVFSFGDLGLKKGFAKLYQKENPTKSQIEKVIKKWSPYKSYGTITLWHSLDNN